MLHHSGPDKKPPTVTMGIDTHADTHHIGIIDQVGKKLTDTLISADSVGYTKAVEMAAQYGVDRVGIECTGSYGAGITSAFHKAGFDVIDVNRPNRFDRSRQGKTDVFDAFSAAYAAASGQASAKAKTADGLVESVRVLHNCKTGAIKARTAVMNQITGLLVSADEQVRAQFRRLKGKRLIAAIGQSPVPQNPENPADFTRVSLALLAQLWTANDKAATEAAKHVEKLLTSGAPELLERFGVGPDTAATLLITAGDNPERIGSEGQFAMLCGVAPVPASSGKTSRYRLNHGGNRQGNRALHQVVLTRISREQRTKDYVSRRIEEGKSLREIRRCLKRFVARELFPVICRVLATDRGISVVSA